MKRRFRMGALAGLLLLSAAALPASALAQDDAVASDRPGFGDGSAVVPPGRFQAEAGYAYTQTGDLDQHALGQLVLRLGVLDRIELRALLNSYVLLRGAVEESGFEDFVVGAKVNLLPGDGQPLGQPSVTAIVSAALPTGGEVFTNDDVRPEGKLALDLGLSETVAVSANAGYSFSLGDEANGLFFTYLSLGAALPDVEGLGVFAGLFSLFPDGGDSLHGLDGGLTFLPNVATQLDLNVGVGLSEGAPDFSIGAGVARRF